MTSTEGRRPEQVAADLLARVEADRAYWARAERLDPGRAAKERKRAAKRGQPCEFDDPPVHRVLSSELEAVCRALLGLEQPASSADPNQLDMFEVSP